MRRTKFPVAAGRRTLGAKGAAGRGDWIRTSDILLPKQALYRTELRPAPQLGGQGFNRPEGPRQGRLRPSDPRLAGHRPGRSGEGTGRYPLPSVVEVLQARS